MAARNKDQSQKLLTLKEVAPKIGMGKDRLYGLLKKHGSQHSLEELVDKTFDVTYTRSLIKELPEPIIPYFSRSRHAMYRLTDNVVLSLEQAIKTLDLLGKNMKDGYSNFRLAETFLMKDAYSAQQISEETEIPLEFIVTKMSELYKAKDFKAALWKGLINPFYVEKPKYKDVAHKLRMSFAQAKKLSASYSIPELERKFNVHRTVISKIVLYVRGKWGYERIFEDELGNLRVPKYLIDFSSEHPLIYLQRAEQKIKGIPQITELVLTEKNRKAGVIIGASDIARKFGINDIAASWRLNWLAEHGYKEQVLISYLGHSYMQVSLLESDIFVASTFNEGIRKQHYYTDEELFGRFPHISGFRIRGVLARFRDKILDAYGGRLFVEKDLIDCRSCLRTQLTKQNKLSEQRSKYITIRNLAPFSDISPRGLRAVIQRISRKYRSDISLAGGVYYIRLKSIRENPGLREELHIRAMPPPQVSTPQNLKDIIYATISASEIILNRMHRDNIPNYLAPYLEYIIHDVRKPGVNTKLGDKFGEVVDTTDTFDLLKEMYNVTISRQQFSSKQRIMFRHLNLKLNKYLS